MTLTANLLASLADLPGRCADCGYHAKIQGHRATCPNRNEGQRRAVEGMSRAESAHPSDVAIVDRAIDSAIASGNAFSANNFRHLCNELEQPNVIGARIRAYLAAKKIRRIGDQPSSLPGTHAHRIGVYVRSNA